MATVNISWNTVSGASGYRIHAGTVSTLYTVATGPGSPYGEDITPGSATSGSITVPTSETWYVVVAALDSLGYEGLYSAEQTVEAGTVSPPVGVPVLSVR